MDNNVFDIPVIPKNYTKNTTPPTNPVPDTLDNSKTEVLDVIEEVQTSPEVNSETNVIDSPTEVVSNPQETVVNNNLENNNSEVDLSTLMADEMSKMDINPPAASPVEQPVNTPEVSPDVNVNSSAPIESVTSQEDITPFVNPNAESNDAISLNPVASLPDTLDQDYGVIKESEQTAPTVVEAPVANVETNETTTTGTQKQSDASNVAQPEKATPDPAPTPEKTKPKKEKAPKEKKKKSPVKIVLLSLLFVVLIVFGIFGFLAYKYYFTLDPVKSLSDIIKTETKDINDKLINNSSYKLLKENDGFEYTSNITYKTTKDDYNTLVTGALIKSSNKASLKFDVKNNNIQKYNLTTTLLNNTFFVKFIPDSFFYRVNSENELNIGELIDEADINSTINNVISVFEKNIQKEDFSSRVMRIKPNDKNIIVNKYSLKMSGSKFKDILKECIESEKNSNVKLLLEQFKVKNLTDKELTADLYVSLNKLEKIDITYSGHSMVIIFNENGSYTVRFDDTIINISKSSDEYKFDISNRNNDETALIEIKLIDSINDKEAKQTIDFNYTKNNEAYKTFNYEHTLVANDDVYVSIPYNIKDFDVGDGRIKYNEEKESLFEKESFLYDFFTKK